MKRCSISVIMKEMQIKTTMKYYVPPKRMSVIKKTRDNKCWWRCKEKGNTYLFIVCDADIMENNMEVPPKVKNRTTIWSSNSTSGYTSISKGNEITISNICIPMIIATLFTIAKAWKWPKYPSKDEWIKKKCYIYENYSTIEKKEILQCGATWMYTEGIMLNKSDIER